MARRRENRWIRAESGLRRVQAVVDPDAAAIVAAVALAVAGEAAASKTGRKRAVTRAIAEVAHYLGNTPAVCRKSYIDPRVFDAYRGGLVIRPVLEQAVEVAEGGLPIHQRAVEEAVLELIGERERSPALERVAA